jgi:hypothetical protein
MSHWSIGSYAKVPFFSEVLFCEGHKYYSAAAGNRTKIITGCEMTPNESLSELHPEMSGIHLYLYLRYSLS